ncbi:MAG TPA: 6-pyruvoyl-tetrahydropterin synthase-related protein [Terriglobales bacterium]|nr:6-pyruvoyl-tetrahydropterin synthase-related protein [Terriglobales bacterium]
MTESFQPFARRLLRSPWLAAALVSMAVSAAIVSPFFFFGNASGHDIEFHASSWMDVAYQWKEGILFPRWTEWANYGYGEPRFIFYPPLSRLIGAALGLLFPWTAVASISIFLVQSFSGVSAYALVRRFAPHRPALLGASFYTANLNALLIIYLRSDYAELLATAFYPLLLLACLNLCGWQTGTNQSTRRNIVFFALALAGVWLANAPAGVIATYAVTFVFAWAAYNQRSWLPLARGAGGLALGLGLCAFYLIPAAFEERWVNIGQALSSGLAPADNFLFTNINDPDHNAFNFLASSVALLLMFMIFCAILAGWHRLRSASGDLTRRAAPAAWQALLALAALSALLMCPFTLPLWKALPELRFVQFPWRWMSILALAFSVFCAVALVRRRRLWIWACIIFLLLGGAGTYLGTTGWWDEGDFPSVQDAITQGQGFEGTDEYDPRGDDHLDLPQNQPQAKLLPANPAANSQPDAKFHVERWTAEDRRITVDARQPVRLAIRLLDYPAWRVTLNGKRVEAIHEGTTRAMYLALEPGTSHVEIRFARTPDRIVGGYASLAALLAAGLLWYFPEQKQPASGGQQ